MTDAKHGTQRRALLRNGLFGMAAAAAGGAAMAAPGAAVKKDAGAEEYDIVIVGTGCAGLSAAIEAADIGAKVIVLEKMPVPMGNTIYAGGNFNAAGTWVQARDGIKDDVESFYKDMVKVSMNRCDMDLMRMFCDESAGVIRWLTDRCGIQWKPLDYQIAPMLGRCHEVTGKVQPGGSQLTIQMLAEVKKLGVPVHYGEKVIELTHDEALRCTGVSTLDSKGVRRTYRARGGVVLCTGGFHNNKDMLTRYMGGSVAWMPLRGSVCCTGENVTLTAPFFPNYVNMDQFHAGPIHAKTRANPSNMVNFGICVTPEGERYIDEGQTYVFIAQNTPRRIPENRAFIILDSRVRKEPIVDLRFKRYEKAKAPIYKADTIEALAREAGLPPEKLARTVKEFNEACRKGTQTKLAVPSTMEKPRTIEEGPFYAFEFSGGMTATFGGPKINRKADVLNLEGRPVPGLYAAGNAIGGLFYDNYLDGSQLTAAVIWGRVAAHEALARAKAGTAA